MFIPHPKVHVMYVEYSLNLSVHTEPTGSLYMYGNVY